MVPLFRGVTAPIAVVGGALYAGYSLCEISEFVLPGYCRLQINTMCEILDVLLLLVNFLIPCGFYQVYLTSVTWSGVELFVLTVSRVYSFGSDPDQSGRIVLQGLVAAPRIIRLGENCPRGEELGL